jgi:serpin B
MWTTQKYYPKVLQPYRNTISKLYDAEFSKLPAKNGEVEVNNWVSDITKGKITNIIDQVSPDTAFLIVNALYFKASWAKSFEEGKPQEFTKFDGKKIIVPMMTRESKKQAAGRFTTELVKGRSDKCISVAIPYEAAEGLGNEGRFEMLIIMPEHHQGLQTWQFKAEKNVNEVSTHDNIIEMALASLEDSRDNRDDHIINMPEFTIDSNIGAVPMLQKLGVDAAFDTGDFKGIVEDEPLKVSKIKHRATIEVTKEGTVGAAASAIELVALSASLSAPKTIDVNKPFLFFVRDTQLNAILFAGKYFNPDGNTTSQ